MPGFRSLAENEEVEYDFVEAEKGLEATIVTGPSQSECKGSSRRVVSKKRFRRIRFVFEFFKTACGYKQYHYYCV